MSIPVQIPPFTDPQLRNVLKQIVSASGAGEGSQTRVGQGPPTTEPTDASGDTYYNSTDNNFWVFQNGWNETLGANGRRTAELALYIYSVTAPTTFPSGTSTYMWSNATYDLPGTPNGWSLTPPLPVQGSYLWRTVVVYTDTDVSPTSTVTWPSMDQRVEPISYAGANGSVGATGTSTYQFPAYTRSDTVPGTPVMGTGSWNFGDGVGTAPTGSPATQVWSLTPPAGTTPQLYVSYTTAATQTVGTPVTNLTWTQPVPVDVVGAPGMNGQSIILYTVYTVSDGQPTTPTGGMFNFSTRTGTPPMGWNNNQMTGTNWVSQAVAYTDTPGGTWVGDAMSWSTPVRVTGATGSSGAAASAVDISGYTVLYKDTAGNFTPNPVTLSAVIQNISSPTYSWAVTGSGVVISGSTTNADVTFSVTTSATLTEAVATVVVSGTNLASSITKSITLPVSVQNTPGQAGNNGSAASYPSVYQWTSSSTAPGRPTTVSRFIWSTGVLGDAPGNTLDQGWSYTVPANTTPGNYLWEITVPIASTPPAGQSLTFTDYNWAGSSLPVRSVAYNGTQGADGTSGTGSFFIQISGSTARVPTNAEFMAIAQRLPVLNDLATVQPISAPGNTTTYRCTVAGTASVEAMWTQVTQYIPGSLIVQNTVTADRLNVSSLSAVSANLGIIYMPNSGSNDRMVLDGTNNRIDVYNGGNLRVRIGNLG